MGDMERELIGLRIGGEGLARVRRMAGALNGDGNPRSKLSPTLRAVIADGLTAREATCKKQHRGPIAAGACGHCGREL